MSLAEPIRNKGSVGGNTQSNPHSVLVCVVLDCELALARQSIESGVAEIMQGCLGPTPCKVNPVCRESV